MRRPVQHTVRSAEADTPANRIHAAEEVTGERLVDDRHARRRLAIRVREGRPASTPIRMTSK